MKFTDIKPFTNWGQHKEAVRWSAIERVLEEWKKDYGLDIDPDFQREHVWTEKQQIAYVEYCLRSGRVGRDILFNCDWGNFDIETRENMVLVDGKQRLQAVRLFMSNKIEVFGHKHSEFDDKLNMTEHVFFFYVNNLKTKKEVLQWYLDLNTGGTIHTEEEIEKVKLLLKKEE